MSDQPGSEQPPSDRPTGRRGFLDAVAEELAELRRDVTKLRTNQRGNAGVLAETVPRLDGLEQAVATLAGRVDVLAQADEDDTARLDPAVLDALGLNAKPGTPWAWPALEADTAALAWVQLARFVGEVLTPRQRPTRAQLPDCWPVHPHAVEALTWLRATYRAAHVGKAPAAAAAEWATRWLPGAWKTIADGMGHDCGPGYHDIDYKIRTAFEQVRRREEDPAPPQQGTGGMFRFDENRADEAQQQRDVVTQVLDGHGPAARPRVMNAAELVSHDRASAGGKLPSTPDLWRPVWQDAAAEDVAARRAKPSVKGFQL